MPDYRVRVRDLFLVCFGIEWERMSFQDLEYSRRLLIGRRDPRQAVAAGLFQIRTAIRNFERLGDTISTPRNTPELPGEGMFSDNLGTTVSYVCNPALLPKGGRAFSRSKTVELSRPRFPCCCSCSSLILLATSPAVNDG
ncbi:hypothetical protein MUK42_35523 [Musa troglodytarum]|uniref:Uncharacterized protein n=1 Tax=Musa troglodytarum TaxID=320322 RepID=A0A9E7FD93_9LILI|nr:hypothetical protein MUK42_35523 [Musa troglodytarum]